MSAGGCLSGNCTDTISWQLDIEELNQTGKLDTQVRRVQADEKFKTRCEGRHVRCGEIAS